MRDEIDDDVETVVPERDFWKRSYFLSNLPQDIAKSYLEIKRRFGIDVANLILLAYKYWGSRVAKTLSNRIISMGSLKDVLNFLEEKSRLFDARGRKILAELIYSFKYNNGVDEILSIVSEREQRCPSIKNTAISIYHSLVSMGYFPPTRCLVEYAEKIEGCGSVSSSCEQVVEKIEEVLRS